MKSSFIISVLFSLLMTGCASSQQADYLTGLSAEMEKADQFTKELNEAMKNPEKHNALYNKYKLEAKALEQQERNSSKSISNTYNPPKQYNSNDLRNKIMNDVDEHNRQYKQDIERIRSVGRGSANHGNENYQDCHKIRYFDNPDEASARNKRCGRINSYITKEAFDRSYFSQPSSNNRRPAKAIRE